MATSKPKAPSLTLCIELQGPVHDAQARLKDGRALATRLRPKGVCLFFSQDAGLLQALKTNKDLQAVKHAAWGALPALLGSLKGDWVALFPAKAAVDVEALTVEENLLERSDLLLFNTHPRLDERLWRSLHRYTHADLSAPALLRVQALRNAKPAKKPIPAAVGAQFLRRCLDAGARLAWRGTTAPAPWTSTECRQPPLFRISLPRDRSAWLAITVSVFVLATLLLKIHEATLGVLAMSIGILLLGQALGERA